MAQAQLHLINLDIEESLWKLDERTIRVGREGLAKARAALAQAARNQLDLPGEPGGTRHEDETPDEQPAERPAEHRRLDRAA